jgi:hypothetical protein
MMPDTLPVVMCNPTKHQSAYGLAIVNARYVLSPPIDLALDATQDDILDGSWHARALPRYCSFNII